MIDIVKAQRRGKGYLMGMAITVFHIGNRFSVQLTYLCFFFSLLSILSLLLKIDFTTSCSLTSPLPPLNPTDLGLLLAWLPSPTYHCVPTANCGGQCCSSIGHSCQKSRWTTCSTDFLHSLCFTRPHLSRSSLVL